MKRAILSAVIFLVILFIPIGCAAILPVVPPVPPDPGIEEIIRKATSRMRLYFEEGMFESSFDDTKTEIFHLGGGDEVYPGPDEPYRLLYSYHMQAEEGGLWLMERLYRWHENARQKFSFTESNGIRERTTFNPALTDDWMQDSVDIYHIDRVTEFPDVPDIQKYEAKAWELSPSNIKYDIPYTDTRYANPDYSPEIRSIECVSVSRITAAWDDNGQEQLLDCWYLDFSLEEDDAVYSHMKFFINTDWGEDSIVWVHIRGNTVTG